MFIPLHLIEAAVNAEITGDIVKRVSFGVDVARYGDDETVIAKNINGAVTLPVVRRGQRPFGHDTVRPAGFRAGVHSDR